MKSDQTVLNIVSSRPDDGYAEFAELVSRRFDAASEYGSPLFTTDAEGLYEAYLSQMPDEARQHYTCNACKNFIERFGGLVIINQNGSTESALWQTALAPEFFKPSIRAMTKLVETARVTGVFVSSAKILGTPTTGVWNHLSAELGKLSIHKAQLLTAGQRAAELKEDFKMLRDSMLTYSEAMIGQAVALLETEVLYRSEKCLGVAKWFNDIVVRTNKCHNSRQRENLTWLAVSVAPAGFCHVKSTMIGTLLDDLKDNLPFEDVSRRFADKMYPLQYQRPSAAPSAGNIAEAEKIVAKLQAANALSRRFARLEELPKLLWAPPAPEVKKVTPGVFAHITPRDAEPEVRKMKVASQTMTWSKFSREILPDAQSIEFYVPSHSENYGAIVTAVDPDAPPILQWDSLEQRNPFSWYVYSGGSYPSRWNLTPDKYCPVTAVCLQPSMWYAENSHQGKSVFFILKGAKDLLRPGLAIFPEILKSEFHGIRATIEAFSRQGVLAEPESASACGIRLQGDGRRWRLQFRVVTRTTDTVYHLDRWD